MRRQQCLWRLPAGAGGQLAGLEPPLERPLQRGPAQLGGQHPADLRRGAGRVLTPGALSASARSGLRTEG